MRKVTIGRILIVISLLLQSIYLFGAQNFSDNTIRITRIVALISIIVGIALLVHTYLLKKN
jgi:hypothetical protein